MAFGTRVKFEDVREVAFGSVAAGYTAIGSALGDRARIITFYNTTDTDVYISDDGVNNKMRLPSGSGKVLDFTAAKVRDDGLFVHEGTVFYVKRTAMGAPSVGNVWIEVTAADGGI